MRCFMQWFEDTALDTFPYEISLWKRYVDDTVVVLMDALLEDFTNHINSIHPAIKFTWEEETEKSLAVLDAKITRDNLGKLSFSVYRKPTHMDQYLQYSSNQPLQHKLGVIRTLVHCSNTICSNEVAQDYEIKHVKKVLRVSRYSKKAWKVATTPNARSEHPSPDVSRDTKGSVTIPYMWVRSPTTSLGYFVKQVWLPIYDRITPFGPVWHDQRTKSKNVNSRALCTMSAVQTARQPTSERQCVF